MPLVCEDDPVSGTTGLNFGGAIVLTRSAHDLGAVFAAGEEVVFPSEGVDSSPLAWAATPTALARRSAFEVGSSVALATSEVEVEVNGALRAGLEGKEMLGIAGTIGMDGVGRCETLGLGVGVLMQGQLPKKVWLAESSPILKGREKLLEFQD